MNELGEISVCYAVRFERRSRHSPARLWRAITEADEVAKWMGFPARIDLRPGGEYVLDFDTLHPGDKLEGVILRVEPERLLRYAVDTSVVEWSIEPDADGCRHVFGQTGLPPRDNEEELIGGWHDGLDSLDQYLDGVARTWADSRRHWAELKIRYRPLLAEALGDAYLVGGPK
jgi:uncharacterized protein YndB with AHSA1/START domain